MNSLAQLLQALSRFLARIEQGQHRLRLLGVMRAKPIKGEGEKRRTVVEVAFFKRTPAQEQSDHLDAMKALDPGLQAKVSQFKHNRQQKQQLESAKAEQKRAIVAKKFGPK